MGFTVIKYVAQFFNSDTDEQTELIKNIQDFFLKYQYNFFLEQSSCPKCSKKSHKKCKFDSDFHSAFTDHKVTIQRLGCASGWQSQRSIKRIYGNVSHPELVNLQITNSAEKSFDKANKCLNDICCNKRKINNHATLINHINKVGSLLEKLKLSSTWSLFENTPSKLILNIEGGHIQNREKNKNSFEELVATTYRAEDLVEVSANKKEIKHKVSVASAMKDRQKSIKKLNRNTCLQ